MINIEKYKDEILKVLDKEYSCGAMEMIYKFAEHKTSKPFKSYYDLFNWLCEEYQEPLLTDDEKEYLCDLKKWYDFDEITVNYVYVNLLQEVNDATAKVVASVTLPSTLHSVPFTHLDCGKIYTLEELGL